MESAWRVTWPSRRLLESLGGVLGGLEDVWGGARAPLGACKRRLERSKKTSKTVLNDHRGQQGPKMDPRRVPKRGPKSSLAENAEIIKTLTQYTDFNDFRGPRGSKWSPKWGPKRGPKRDLDKDGS